MTNQIDDDAYPGTAIAYIRATWGSQSFVGSGALVGRNDVLTAAHVVYSATFGRLADRIEIAFSYDPNEGTPAWINPVWVQWYRDFDPNRDTRISSGDGRAGSLAGAELDVALLSLGTAPGDRNGWFGMDPNSQGGSVGVIGHPSVYGNRMMFDAGTATKDAVDNVFNIRSDLEINGGNSGGPIYVGNYSIVGVVSTAIAAAALTAHWNWLIPSISINDGELTRGQDVFRFYNANTGAHFFTASMIEARDVAGGSSGYAYEGLAFGTLATASTGIPVYRLYNFDTGRHFYTASRSEMLGLDARREWALENTAFYAYGSGGAGRDEIYRFFNTKTGVHLYTNSENERDTIIASNPVFKYEGIAYYTDLAW
ncbi:trypsin-like peptidase domain-containing protein [Roseococcus sp. SDR]|uniref:trypsin-like peptidase domain-containing protein n=1 Tax=Roseococcus sp. SDR TaxID=2835532 RepID=UPI001BCC99AB|nr:trypsin-like peptidase domain-containing protein [Roseococcus sp. SDR]MBS7791442.1 trypsin-like peptidase domain-containing protein [Roseococcus sp. SDR]MBV1846756.1 trypsin-like peptidase domain-containing protein [Roseococcus sp. SDR]